MSICIFASVPIAQVVGNADGTKQMPVHAVGFITGEEPEAKRTHIYIFF